jgi:hypothetical protein
VIRGEGFWCFNACLVPFGIFYVDDVVGLGRSGYLGFEEVGNVTGLVTSLDDAKMQQLLRISDSMAVYETGLPYQFVLFR